MAVSGVFSQHTGMLQSAANPDLIFTWGNPSRGDDALGPAIYELLQNEDLNGVDLLTDFQLQIEHAVDLEGHRQVLFVDASLSANPPFEIFPLQPLQDASYSSHAMSPQSLLAVYQQVYGCTPPPAFLLSIRGYEFGLGLPVSATANQNLLAAFNHIKRLLDVTQSDACTDFWPTGT
jgi:hydrogenase maturation protease